MSSVTPIRPDLPPQTPPERSLKVRIDGECRRIYMVRAVMELAERALLEFSGDEDSLEIVAALSDHALALEAARNLLGHVVEKLEETAHDIDNTVRP